MRLNARRVRIVGQGERFRVRLLGDWEQHPLQGVKEVRGIERALGKALREQVRRARAAGCSWADIGEVLGTTRQAAWERFSGDH
jgi:hypothetical protein